MILKSKLELTTDVGAYRSQPGGAGPRARQVALSAPVAAARQPRAPQSFRSADLKDPVRKNVLIHHNRLEIVGGLSLAAWPAVRAASRRAAPLLATLSRSRR